jgi:EAL domain-containing protein (putative c-di-GMP-specific phosphodiesterase class I)
MNLEKFKVRGFIVEPYFQLYQNLDDPKAMSGELLTRLENGKSAYEVISQLTIVEHLELLEWLIHNSNQLMKNFGLHCSMNIDNNIVIEPRTRDEFLRISEMSVRTTTFEFTETHAMPNAADANKLFRRLRDQGHSCALDDFGTGLNGMTLLTDYDFDIVKVDRALTIDIETRPEKLKVISLLNEMISALNKSHVVEGVETKEVYDLLITAGFRVFQGYLLDKPIPISELNVSQLLKEQR